MIYSFYASPCRRKYTHRPSKINNTEKQKRKRKLQGLKKKAKVGLYGHPNRFQRKLRLYYHDRAAKNPYFYEYQNDKKIYWKNQFLKYSSNHLQFAYLFEKYLPGYASVLNTVNSITSHPVISKYQQRYFLLDKKYPPVKNKNHCVCPICFQLKYFKKDLPLPKLHSNCQDSILFFTTQNI